MKKVYLMFAVIGAVLPYCFLIPFLITNGLDLRSFADLLFANAISTFFAVDFFISCAFFAFVIFCESAKLKMQRFAWICLIVLCTIGLSCAFPLFMYFRESFKHREN